MQRLLSKLLAILIPCMLIGCSDYTIYGGETEYIEVPVEVIVEVEVEVEVPNGDPQGDVWVEHFTQPSTSNGTDILWVLDFSCSMSDDGPQVIAGIEAMINALPPAGWRLNMISADPNNAAVESQFPLVPGDTIVEALDMYNAITHGQWESGLESVYTYIEDNPWSQEWMRDDATLLTVFVSDERDSSYNITLDEFIAWYEMQRSPGSTFASGILNPIDNGGYQEVVDHFSGVTVDIADLDWSLGVADAATQVLPLEEWTLEFTPIPESVVVFLDGEFDASPTWWLDEPSDTIVFDIVPEAGTLVEIGYIIDNLPNE